MVPKPVIALSDDVLALFNPAEVAGAQAPQPPGRERSVAQLDYMFELGPSSGSHGAP